MEWQDQGIIISTKLHGENGIILELLTSKHGRHSGLVRGGRSKKNRPILQLGNIVAITWKARLPEHLGFYSVELLESNASILMESKIALAGLTNICLLAHNLPEREPQQGIYEATLLILKYIEDIHIWPNLLVRWEMELLNQLGYQLDLSTCAATGTCENLIYVSPKSGRAVSKEAGEPYKDKLFTIPSFLRSSTSSNISPDDLEDGFKLTGYFLEKHVLSPKNQHLPEARSRMIAYLTTP